MQWAETARGWMQRLGRILRPRALRRLKLCESLPLGDRRFIAVVQFEQQRFLIGGGGNTLALLTQLPKADEGTQGGAEKDQAWKVVGGGH